MSPRKLRPEELQLWQKVARTTEKLTPDSKPIETMSDVFASAEEPNAPSPEIPAFKVGEKANGARRGLPGIATGAQSQAIQMDRKAYDRLKRGKLKPQGRIDLHGMTLDQAHPALIAFVMSSFTKDRRLILVITGKGQGKSRDDVGPIPERPGILRRNVPHWLQTPPLAQVVLQVTEAHGRHGGGGAFYVYLRRRR